MNRRRHTTWLPRLFDFKVTKTPTLVGCAKASFSHGVGCRSLRWNWWISMTRGLNKYQHINIPRWIIDVGPRKHRKQARWENFWFSFAINQSLSGQIQSGVKFPTKRIISSHVSALCITPTFSLGNFLSDLFHILLPTNETNHYRHFLCPLRLGELCALWEEKSSGFKSTWKTYDKLPAFNKNEGEKGEKDSEKRILIGKVSRIKTHFYWKVCPWKASIRLTRS